MILLDTYVVSALMRDPPNPEVTAWLDQHAPDRVWTSAITAFEVRHGPSRLPEGSRRRALEGGFEAVLRADFPGRVAPLDAAARLAAARDAAGRPVELRDTLLAGIALARGAAVATRNTRHFADLVTGVLDPWGDGGREE